MYECSLPFCVFAAKFMLYAVSHKGNYSNDSRHSNLAMRVRELFFFTRLTASKLSVIKKEPFGNVSAFVRFLFHVYMSRSFLIGFRAYDQN